MDGAAVNPAGEDRITARTGRAARQTKRRLAIHPRNDCHYQRSTFARVVRCVPERIGRTVSTYGGGPKLSSCPSWRFGGAHCTDDEDCEPDRAALSAIECRSFAGRRFVSR